MITRVYCNNFRSLVNFEIKVGQLGLLLGQNGSGKSSVLDGLRRLVEYVTGDAKVEELFPVRDFTRWQDHAAPVQRFELDMTVNDHKYTYCLEVEHEQDRKLARMKTERLECDGNPLFDFAIKDGSGEAQLYHDDFTEGPAKFPADWSKSGVGFLQERRDNQLLSAFKKRLARVIVVRPAPQIMRAESDTELRRPDVLLRDFASWLRFLLQEHQGQVFDLTAVLREVVPGFDSFSLREAGEAKMLYVGMRNPAGKVGYVRFDDLSDGERMLMALYALLSCVPQEPFTLAVDEPENFVALPEIQPWIDALRDHLEEHNQCQALLISHHPRLIDFLASDLGVWISRKGKHGPSRAEPIQAEAGEGGMSVSRLIERGWIYDA